MVSHLPVPSSVHRLRNLKSKCREAPHGDSVTSVASAIRAPVAYLVASLKRVQILRGKTIIQFICMIAIAVTTIFHVDAKFSSAKVNGAVSFAASQNDDQGGSDKVIAELCNFCSDRAACADLDTLSVVQLARQAVPPGQTRSLIAFELPAISPPPRS